MSEARKKVLSFLSVSFMLIVFLFSGAAAVPAAEPVELANKVQGASPAQCYQQVIELLENCLITPLPKNWQELKSRKPQTSDELHKMLEELVQSTGEPELRLLTSGEAAKRDAFRSGGYVGIGVTLKRAAVVSASGIRVEEVFTDSPAEAAGLAKNDVISAVDGRSMVGYSLLQVTETELKGVPGTSVTLTVQRQGKELQLKLTREVDRTLGIKIRALDSIDGFVFQSVREDTSAGKAGIQVGDILAQLDGQNAGNFKQPADYIRNGLLGTKLELTLTRSNSSRKITLERQSVAYGTERLMTAMNSSNNGGWSHLLVQNLDWHDLPKEIDAQLAEHQRLPGLVLDLRGAHGSDPSLAAQVLSRFIQSDKPLISAWERSQSEENGKTEMPFSGSAAKIVYAGKMVVLVDSKTSGTAEAVAGILQKSGRATIRGAITAGQPLLSEVKDFTLADGSQIFVQLPVRQLTSQKSNAIQSVVPDSKDVELKSTDRYWEDEVSTRAHNDLDGTNGLIYSQWFPMVIAGGIAGLILLVVLLKAGLQKQQVADQTHAEDSREISDRNVNPPPSWRTAIALLLTLGVVIGGIASLHYFINRPAAGLHGEVVVEVFVDGSPAGQTQAAVAQKLAGEYSGPVNFKILDTSKGDAAPADIKYFPTVRYSKIVHDSTGKVISQSSSSGGEATRAKLVDRIGSLIKEDDGNHLPILPVERHKR